MLYRYLFSGLFLFTSFFGFTQTEDKELVFREDFSPAQIDWQVADLGDRTTSISNSTYHFESKGTEKAVITAREIPAYIPDHFFVKTALRSVFTDGSGYGLVFGYLNVSNFHIFNISENGYFRYGYYSAGEYVEPIGWTPSDRIAKGEINEIMVEVKDDNKIELYINNHSVASITFPGKFGEKVGFISYGKQKIDISTIEILKTAPESTTPVISTVERPEVEAEVTKMVQERAIENSGYEYKYALVIGNSSYTDMPLKNPSNDARAISNVLRDLDFEVIELIDAERKDFRNAIREFSHLLNDNKGVALFYYAGHGIQSNGINYLVPIGADIQNEFELQDECIRSDLVLRMLSNIDNPMNIIILDACRNNPFARSFRSAEQGLAQPQTAPTGSIIAFATAPGRTASDGEGENGLYTQELIKTLSEPGLSVEEVFKRVRIKVNEISNGEQIPWENSSLMGDFYFNLKKK